MRQSHIILTNAAIMWIARVLLLVPQLIMVPFLIRTIGETGYGIYALIWSLMMSLDHLEMSLQQGVIKYSAAYLAQNRIDEVNKVVSTSFVFSVGIAVLASAGILLAAFFYDDPTGLMKFSLVVVGVMVLFIIPITPYISVIQSRQRYYVKAITETISRYLSLAILFVWFHFVGPSVQSLIVIMSLTLFLSRLVQVPVAYRMVQGLFLNPKVFCVNIFRLLFSFGGVAIIGSLCIAINSTGVRWLVGFLVSTNFVAHLAIIFMPGILLSQLVSAMMVTIMPATSAYEAIGNYNMLRKLLIHTMRYTTILIMAAIISAVFLMNQVLVLWVGDEYAFLEPYALIFFIGQAFLLSTGTARHVLKGMGRLRDAIIAYLIGLVFVPYSLILLFYFFEINAYLAVTVGLSIGFVVSGCLQIFMSARALKLDLRQVLFPVYWQPFVLALVICLLAFGFNRLLNIESLFWIIILTGMWVFIYMWFCYFFIATSEEKMQTEKVLQYILKMVRR